MPSPGAPTDSDPDRDANSGSDSGGGDQQSARDTTGRADRKDGEDGTVADVSNRSRSDRASVGDNGPEPGPQPGDGGAASSPNEPAAGDRAPGVVGWGHWFLTTSRGWPVFVREVVSSALIVALVGLLLFGVSGVWPPMVAVESGSMEPHMHRGDLVFIMDEHRLVPDAAQASTGVVTHETGSDAGYRKFGSYGDVIVFDPPEKSGPPIIHRAHFWVDAGENWYGRANPEYVDGDSCREIASCPAPHAGFITRGDANPTYDQVNGIAGPVRPAWITGTAEVRIPLLGHVRLRFSELDLPELATLAGPVSPISLRPTETEAGTPVTV